MPESVQAPVVALVSLGCAKNTVDSERLLAELIQDGFMVAEDPRDADLCLVNTCGFIGPAREETAATLAGIARGRRRGHPRRLVALGCLVERAAEQPDFARFLEAADARWGFADYPNLARRCRDLLAEADAAPASSPALPHHAVMPAAFHELPRLVTGAGHSAPLKIAEGCSNRCAYCTIPLIRGPLASRPLESIVREARDLAAGGVRELSLIAQDTAAYGLDRGPGAARLPELLRALGEALPAEVWIRVLYAHPRHLTDAILDAMAADARICPYLDLPLQHIADPMLSAMGRNFNKASTLNLLDRIRARLPEAALRTTFITGFPGESDQLFQELLDFVCEGRFLHLGTFAYSPEPDTPAAAMPAQVSPAVAAERRDRLLAAQREVSRRLLCHRVGTSARVMMDGPAPRGAPGKAHWVGRLPQQAPEVDGVVYLMHRGGGLEPGTVVQARVTRALDYDLIAEA